MFDVSALLTLPKVHLMVLLDEPLITVRIRRNFKLIDEAISLLDNLLVILRLPSNKHIRKEEAGTWSFFLAKLPLGSLDSVDLIQDSFFFRVCLLVRAELHH